MRTTTRDGCGVSLLLAIVDHIITLAYTRASFLLRGYLMNTVDHEVMCPEAIQEALNSCDEEDRAVLEQLLNHIFQTKEIRVVRRRIHQIVEGLNMTSRHLRKAQQHSLR